MKVESPHNNLLLILKLKCNPNINYMAAQDNIFCQLLQNDVKYNFWCS